MKDMILYITHPLLDMGAPIEIRGAVTLKAVIAGRIEFQVDVREVPEPPKPDEPYKFPPGMRLAVGPYFVSGDTGLIAAVAAANPEYQVTIDRDPGDPPEKGWTGGGTKLPALAYGSEMTTGQVNAKNPDHPYFLE